MTMNAIPTTQATNFYRKPLGDYQVTTLLDGYVDLSYAVWQGVEHQKIDESLERKGLRKGGIRNGISSFLVNTGSKTILIDAGAAGLFGPNAYSFPANLKDVGLTPRQIDEVLVTHLHPDHIGGLLRDGQATLPNAIVRVSDQELAFWTSRDKQQAAPEFMRSWFDLVHAFVKAYDGRLETFKAGQVLSNGIHTMPLSGHTPGQTGYLIESKGQRLLVWGDVAVSTAIQFPNPRAHMIFDIDGDAGYQTRLRTFDMAAADRLVVAGTHLPFPTFGYVTRRDGAYDWVPDEWRYDVTEAALEPVI